MDKTFDPQAIEQRWYEFWESEGFFAPANTDGNADDNYSIMIPPPNVTGSLHMGHAFQHTIMDALVRYQRMRGKNTLWQVGTDHAGIATQMVVERKLAHDTQQTRHDLGRDAFVEKIWDWKEESGGTITRQMRRLGNSVDWASERFTMDPGFYRAVQEVFVRLYDEGLLYRGKRLVNWDPKLHTAISDLEVENTDEKGFLWHFRYPLAHGELTQDGCDHVVVATTRPETMLGDTAVAVHPDDERYQSLIGKTVMLPLVNREIPIIADHYVDREFGTGCVKITPAHDFNDYQVGLRHELPLVNVMDKDAAILAAAEVYRSNGDDFPEFDNTLPAAYAGLDRIEARKAIVAAIDELALLANVDDHALKVPRGDRSGLIIEPLLTDQWFVDAKTLAKPAIDAVESGAIEFVPKQYENMYFSWMRDIQDWCVSRQLWWGHRIPAWYDEDGNVYVAASEEAAREKYDIAASITLHQDNDVLDTWFSSALWTFGTLGWPENTARLQAFHPSSVLVTGFDIIFFWVARMIMMTLHFMKDDNGNAHVPFHTVYVTGLIRDEQGQKMSKSKGNVLDPLDMIDGISLDDLLAKRTGNMMQPQQREKIAKRTKKQFPDGIATHGTDALRFTLAALASTGRDINWDMNRLEGYRNFCNKLWNAARYVLMNVEGQNCGANGEAVELSLADRWIISCLQQVETSVQRHFDNYRFDLASQALYEFIWNEYCDWYLELSKPILGDSSQSAEAHRGTRRTLVRVLEALLRLAHPIMPFITEEIWQSIRDLAGKKGSTIMLQPYPVGDDKNIDSDAIASIEWTKAIIVAVRNIRGEMNLSPAKALPIYLLNGSDADRDTLDVAEPFIKMLARLESITWLEAGEKAPAAATQLVGAMEVKVPLAGFIDASAELARLDKELAKLDKEAQRLQGKLGNAKFIDKAPADVVDKEKQKLADVATSRDKLKEQYDQLQKL